MLNPYRDPLKSNPGKDRRTMIVLFAATIAITGFLFYSIMVTQQNTVDDGSPFNEQNDWGGNLGDRLGYEKVTLPAELEAEIKEDSVATLVLKDKKPFNYLLDEITDRPFRFFNEVGYSTVPGDVSIAEIMEDPAKHRVEQFAVKGELLSLEPKQLELPAPVDEVWEGRLRVENADGTVSYAYFESVEEPRKVRVGQVAQVFGLFFKNYHFAVESDGQAGFQTGPFFIARRVKRSYNYLDVQELDMSVVSRARDTEPLERMEVEDEPWYHVASYAKNQDQDAIREEFTEDTELENFLVFPGVHRGETVKFRGKLVALEKVPLEDNPANLEAYYDGIVQSLDSVTTRVRFVNKPTGVARGDLVAVRGVFLKMHKYESRADTAPEVPLIVGITIDKIEFRDETLRDLSIVAAVVAIGLILTLSISLALGRKSAKAFEDAYWKRRKNRLQKHNPFDAAGVAAGSGAAGGSAADESDEARP